MKVKFFGMIFKSSGNSLPMADFISHVAGNNAGKEYEAGEHKRLIFINTTKNKKYYLGLLITVKDQKKFCELQKTQGKLKIKVNNLDKNNNLMDFNFFVIDKASGISMYQYYHSSCSPNQFGYFLRNMFSEKVRERIDAEREALNHEPTVSELKKIHSKHKSRLSWELLVKKEKLKELIDELESIKSVEFNFCALTSTDKCFTPLDKYVSKERKRLVFSRSTPAGLVSSHITNAANNLEYVTGGRVVGRDFEGFERIISIANNIDDFGEYEHDEVAQKLNSLDIEIFEENWVIKELLKMCKTYEHIFDATLK